MAYDDAMNYARTAAVKMWQENKIDHSVINDIAYAIEYLFRLAQERARAAGYAEAKEQAARAVEVFGGAYSGGPNNDPGFARAIGIIAVELMNRIRALEQP